MPLTFSPALTPLAILSALPQEQRGFMALLQQPYKVAHANRDFWLGRLHGQPVVLALSKIGKVAAATTTAALIERFGVRRIVFTGVAGGLGQAVKVGDVVVATDFVQHDLDVSPLFPRYEVPLYGRTRFHCDVALSALLFEASSKALAHESLVNRGFHGACVHQGLDYGVPFAVMRTISDRADDSAHVDFPDFVEGVASRYAHAIIERFLKSLSNI